MAEATKERIILILEDRLQINSDTVTEESSLKEDLGMDSLDSVDLIIEFEKEYGISIPDEDVEDFVIVGDIINYLQVKT